MKKVYAPAEIEILKKNPNVKDIRSNRLTLTFQFREALYSVWSKNPSVETVRKFMAENGFDLYMIGGDYFSHLNGQFKLHGNPSRGKNEVLLNHDSLKPDHAYDPYLLSSGKFVASKRGLGFHPDFINEIFASYPDVSIEEKLEMSGFDPAKIGYQRIYKLKKLFDGENDESTELPVRHSDDEICMYSAHPYIRRITRKQISLTDSFFTAAYPFKEWHIDKILDIFCLPPALFSVSSRLNLRYRIINHEISGSEEGVLPSEAGKFSLQICRNYMDAMRKMVDTGFDSIRNVIPSIAPVKRKKICDWIASLPADPEKEYTVRHILKRTGISKSSYYAVLKDPDHGTYQTKKELRDKEDAALIRQVMEHSGFKKGTRQVYMQMKAVTGRQFGINKIRRLKKKFGITSGIRKANRSRQGAQALLKNNVKPNLLKRQFRLDRPNRIRLTDVTYLNYGEDKRAYASAVKDPVTGKLISFVVSGNNDLALVRTSLEDVDAEGLAAGTLFHSDQGALYLNDTFQKKVRDAGLKQSMSKRGNCWDNAPQESFFGHFKQECPYAQCDSVEELKKMLARYMEYYNNERKQWEHLRMTPVEYEAYLLSLDEESFRIYLGKEQKRYESMKERAKDRAVERAKTLGVEEALDKEEKDEFKKP